MYLFLFKFVLTNFIFSFVIAALIVSFDKKHHYSDLEILLYSLGLGPACTSLLLYHLFLILPGQSSLFYLLSVLLIYLFLACVMRHRIKDLFIKLCSGIKNTFLENNKLRIENLAITLIVSIPAVFYLVIFFLRILPHPLMGHDVVQYAIVGNMLFEAKSLLPIWSKNFAESGFVYKITCAPSFSLLLTWEHLLNSMVSLKSDLYFRSLSAYYGSLILGLQFHWVAKRNKWLALLAAFVLMSGYGFLLIFLTKHIDSYRIFFACLSWIFLAYSVRDENITAYLLLGAFSGLAASAHRVGIIVAGINCLVFFMIMQGGFKKRLLRTSLIIVFILACGGDHYIFDLIWGTGDWASR